MKLDDECRECLYNSQLKKVERDQTDAQKLALFKEEVKKLCNAAPENFCAPLLMRGINQIHCKIFGTGIDYSKEKKLFNTKLSELEEALYEQIKNSSEPISEAIKFAMASNYIDFARIADLDEGAVDYIISMAKRAEPDKTVLKNFVDKLKTAKTLCILHDNCGEIVLDKILIRNIKDIYPQIKVISVVRGKDIINDVTVKDAYEVGLDKFAEILDNGTDVPGTVIEEISLQTLEVLRQSDIVISKGLGNLETLYGEGYSAFYMFTCKCEHIAKRFNSSLWSAVFAEGC